MKKAAEPGPWLGALVGVAALAAHSPVLRNGFTNWDDPFYALTAPEASVWSVRGGLWQPLSWLSIAADRRAWGDFAGGHHLTGLLLHAATAVVLYKVLVALFERDGDAERARWAAALGAAFWAVHPLRVESVAWAAERKGVLSALFYALSAWAYLAGRGGAALAAFAAALAAKVTALSLPVLLLIAAPRPRREALARLAPFAALAAAAFALNSAAARAFLGGAVEAPPLAWRLGRAAYGLLEYARLTVWPAGLAAYHPPRDWFGANEPRQWACLLALAVAVVALWSSRRRRPGAAALAACYAAAAAPMLGLVQHGLPYAVNERFSHLPGMALGAAFGAAFLRAGPAARAAAAVALAAYGAAAHARSAVWSDSIALWSDARAADPSALADHMLGSALLKEGRAAEAAPLLSLAGAVETRQPAAFENAGAARAALGRRAEAEAIWRAGLASFPSPELSALLGSSWAESSGARARAGEGLLRAALLVKPGNLEWTTDLAAALERRGRRAEARALYEGPLAAPGAPARAALNRGLLAAAEGRAAEAEALYRRALADEGARARAHHNLGVLRAAQGRAAEAGRHYRAALRAGPLAPSAVNLANMLARRGDLAGAEALYLRALALDPSSREARANLAAVRAARGR